MIYLGIHQLKYFAIHMTFQKYAWHSTHTFYISVISMYKDQDGKMPFVPGHTN